MEDIAGHWTPMAPSGPGLETPAQTGARTRMAHRHAVQAAKDGDVGQRATPNPNSMISSCVTLGYH